MIPEPSLTESELLRGKFIVATARLAEHAELEATSDNITKARRLHAFAGEILAALEPVPAA